ncbi:hypothetical protein [Thiocapsa bogorovii]|uniref:hypothetical protein n=1 Tax=Thiocapsa bogorovii TaxID=521689 RepID=UPI001E4D45C6|nr:hypothetical protein [Thiocapsa bogorovii]UHD18036.1 hypothetical protein LT988_08365 [Thiocapsa bogorovii]
MLQSTIHLKIHSTLRATLLASPTLTTEANAMFQNSAAFEPFVAQGLDATAEAGTMTGEQKDQLAMRFNEGKAVFVLIGKSWKIAAKLTGSRYWPDDELNGR